MSKYYPKLWSARNLGILGLISPMLGIILSWLSLYGYFPISPNIIIPTSLFSMVLLLVAAMATLLANTSFVATMPFRRLPNTPNRNLVSRVVVNQETNKEYLVSASLGVSVKDALTTSWPFPEKAVELEWKVRDESGIDVTEMELSMTNGLLCIVFDEYYKEE